LTWLALLLYDEVNSWSDVTLKCAATAKSKSVTTKSGLNKGVRITDKPRCLKKSKQRKVMPGAIDD
jgi:hypothetical protein